jgi:predicted nucleotide-binding protein
LQRASSESGRARVCALYEKGVEIPSDYHGVLFVELDETGKWKFDLAHAMKTAGLPIDMNKAY